MLTSRNAQLNPLLSVLLGALLAIPLFVSGVGGWFPILILVYVLVSAFIGEGLLTLWGLDMFRLAVSRQVASVLLGLLVCSLAVFIFPGNRSLQMLFPLVPASVIGILCRHSMKVRLRLDWVSFFAFCFAAALSLFISMGGELLNMTLPDQAFLSTSNPDQFFYTANVATIRRGSVFSAVYEVGSPLNYHSLSFFIPAYWANVLGISSHQALFGISMFFYKVASFLLVYEVCVFVVAPLKAKHVGRIFFAMLLPVVLAPLHPLYLLKGEVKNLVFSGMGYLLPVATPTYTFAIPLLLLAILSFIYIDWKTTGDINRKIGFVVLASLLVMAKLAVFFCTFVLIAVIVLKRVLVNKERIANYFWYGLSIIVIGITIFKTFMSTQGVSRTKFKYGYLVERFGDLFNMQNQGYNHVLILLLIAAVFALWLGIRWIGLVEMIRSKNPVFSELVIGGFVTLGVTIAITLMLRIVLVDASGAVVRDSTYDVEQFVRIAFYLLTVVSAMGIVSFFSRKQKIVTKMLCSVILVFWSVAAIAALSANTYGNGRIVDDTWYEENYRDLRSGKFGDGLILVHPFSIHGIMLSSSDFGKYWCAQGAGVGCYNSTLKNSYRWDVYRGIVDSPGRELIKTLKGEGVKYIIATPSDRDKIEKLLTMFPDALLKSAGSHWVYELR